MWLSMYSYTPVLSIVYFALKEIYTDSPEFTVTFMFMFLRMVKVGNIEGVWCTRYSAYHAPLTIVSSEVGVVGVDNPEITLLKCQKEYAPKPTPPMANIIAKIAAPFPELVLFFPIFSKPIFFSELTKLNCNNLMVNLVYKSYTVSNKKIETLLNLEIKKKELENEIF